MDKLKLAFSIVAKEARRQREAGEVPTFLGVRGMLALMYDRIVAFSKEEQDNTQYVIDLAIKAMFAVAECLPSFDNIDLEEPREDKHDEPITEIVEGAESLPNPSSAVEDVVDDPSRWTKVQSGIPLPSVVVREDTTDA